MKGKFGKIVSFTLAVALSGCAAAGCGGNNNSGSAPSSSSESTSAGDVIDLDNGYTYTKQNKEGLMQFYSSDAALDEFLNEYMRRHLRYDDEAVGDLKIGEGSTVRKASETGSPTFIRTISAISGSIPARLPPTGGRAGNSRIWHIPATRRPAYIITALISTG